jgi:hypothetical protein
MDTTTDLYKLEQGGYRYTLVKVIEIINITEKYGIVKYYGNEFKNGHATGYNDIRYAVYVDGESTSYSFNTLDQALIGCVTLANMDPNAARFANSFIAGAIGLKDEE